MARRRTWYSWPPTTTTPSGGDGSASRDAFVSSDPWQSQGDPWGASANREDDRMGGSDKISVPEFSGEDDKDGMVTRGYLRKVAAWRRMTRLRPNKQALALYNNLTGRAWRDAEELDLALLDSVNGVDVFTQWVSEKYLDKEVVKVGKCMLEFFKHLKKGYGQEIRDFNQEYDRQVSRLKEVGCSLPDLCLAWLYVDKLRLENGAELNLLSSTGNKYELSKLQDAAVIQDRMNRRLWEPRKYGDRDKKGSHHAHVTENAEAEEDDEGEMSEGEEEMFPESDEETQEAYVTFQNAKSKYQALLKSRGTATNQTSKEDRIKQAKARSYCSACKRRGHWHRDPECPLYKGNKGPAQPAQVSHVCEVFHAGRVENDEIVAITDSACSRSVAGSEWIKRLRENALAKGHHFEVVPQHEQFKFGGDKLFLSKKAWCFWLNICGKWFILKVSEVDADVPLLLSRPALAQLGMRYDLPANVASFEALNLTEVPLQTTLTGLPAVPVASSSSPAPRWPKGVKWDLVEIFVPSEKVAYMVRHAGDVVEAPKKLFYPKKMDPMVMHNLSAEHLCPEWFQGWWRENKILRDFWIEGDFYIDRIHVIPRRDPFDPRDWQTSDGGLKECLLISLGDTRMSTCIPCTSSGKPFMMSNAWRFEVKVKGQQLWIGRSRFLRPQVAGALQSRSPGSPNPGDVQTCLGMEDAACGASRSLDRHEREVRPKHDSAGAEVDLHGGPWTSRENWLGVDKMQCRPTEGAVLGGGIGDTTKSHTGSSDEDVALQHGDHGRQRGDLWAVQELLVQGSAEGLLGVGHHRMEHVQPMQPRLGSPGSMGRSPKAGSKSLSGLWSQVLEGPGADGQDQATTRGPPRSSSCTAQGEERDTGAKVKDQAIGGIRRFLYGVFGGRPYVYRGGDSRAAGTPQDPADCQDGRGCCKDRCAEGWKFGESVKTSGYEDVSAFGKGTDFKDVGESSLAYVTEYNQVFDYEVGRVPHYETEYNLVTDEPYGKHVPEMLEPKLVDGGDYEATRKLFRDETCRNLKKKVKSWAAKVMIALATLVAVWAFSLHAPAPHLIPNAEDAANSNKYHCREFLGMEPPRTKWSTWQQSDRHGQEQTYGFVQQDVLGDSHLRKFTTWIYFHGVYHGDLSCSCQSDHVHAPTDCRDTRAAGIYTYEFCRAVVGCYQSEIVPRCWTPFPAIGDGEFSDASEPSTLLQGLGIFVDGSDVNMEPHELHGKVHGGDQHASRGEFVGDDHMQIDSPSKEYMPAANPFHLHVDKRAAQTLSRWKRHQGHLRPPDHARRFCLAGIGVEGHELLAVPLPSEPLSDDAVRGVVPTVFLMICKPFSGLIHWVKEQNAPFVKRLMIEWAVLEQLISFVLAMAAGWEVVFEDPRMMRWVPTQFQSASVPIKLKTDVQTWWNMLHNLQLSHFRVKVNFKRWVCE